MLVTFTRSHLVAAEARALAGHAGASIIVDGVGALLCDVVSRVISAISPALLAGDRACAIALAANALPPVPEARTEPAAGMVRARDARSFVTWFAELAAQAAVDDMLADVVAVTDRHDPQLVRLTAVGTGYTAILRPGALVSPWLIDTFAGAGLVSRCEVYCEHREDALAVAEAGLRTLAGLAEIDTECQVDAEYQHRWGDGPDVLDYMTSAEQDAWTNYHQPPAWVLCPFEHPNHPYYQAERAYAAGDPNWRYIGRPGDGGDPLQGLNDAGDENSGETTVYALIHPDSDDIIGFSIEAQAAELAALLLVAPHAVDVFTPESGAAYVANEVAQRAHRGERCDCGCGPIPGLLAGMNDGFEVQTAADCPARYDTDEEAAAALARHLGGRSDYYQPCGARRRGAFRVLDSAGRPVFWPGALHLPNGAAHSTTVAAVSA